MDKHNPYLGNGYEQQFSHWFSNALSVVFPETKITDRSSMNVTIVVTQACNFACSYCYQHGKSNERMTPETIKRTVDFLLSDEINNYIDPENSACILFDFIGGEPLLEIDLIDQFLDYFVYEAFRKDHRWALNYTASMSSNGSLYETPKVQNFLKKYQGRGNILITIDGTKELHDSCRRYKDGRGTYDDVERNVRLYFENHGYPSSKVTLAPDNIKYLSESALHLFNLGYKWIHANVVFEDVWSVDLARDFYSQLKELADGIIGKKLFTDHSISIFDEDIGTPMDPSDDQNWCGGDGSMLAIGPDGTCYPCLRYMGYCLSAPGRKPFVIGNINNGIMDQADLPALAELRTITRRSQSTDECFYCPIAKGCSWCSGYNYDVYGTANKRATFHCIMQRSRVLGNCYYWNKLYRTLGMSKRFPLWVPDVWVLELIDQVELDMLNNLSLEE